MDKMLKLSPDMSIFMLSISYHSRTARRRRPTFPRSVVIQTCSGCVRMQNVSRRSGVVMEKMIAQMEVMKSIARISLVQKACSNVTTPNV